jgi:hypothetical protein
MAYGIAFASIAGILHQAEAGFGTSAHLNHAGGAVARSVVHDEDFSVTVGAGIEPSK